MNKLWQRVILIGATFAMMAGAFTVHPYASADDQSGEMRLYRQYIEAMAITRENYVEPIDYEVLTKGAIQGMLRTLDPHSNYYDRKAFDEMRREQRSHYYGIGATIQQRYRGVYIIEPFKGTPAARAGLRYGDQIIAIDDKNTENWNSDQVRNTLRGELGTAVKVTVRRVGLADPVVVTIERGSVDLPSISSHYLLRPGVGYIILSRGFHSTTSDELSKAIAELKEKGATRFILDLRGNPGGFLDQAIKVSDKFLERGQVVLSVRGREGRVPSREWGAESGAPETAPIVVLINRNSASASEIVAGAIQDHDRGLIVGEGSFGKGLVQTIFPLPGGAGLTLTTARYYTPSGRLIQRDYSNGSFYDYISRRNAPGEARPSSVPSAEQRQTDLGRTVFGGGGIEPDIKVESTQLTQSQWTLLSTGLFHFVRDLTAGKVPAAPNFKVGAIEFDHQLQPDEFSVTDEIMKAYRQYMTAFIKEHPDLKLKESMVEENVAWARQRIREEVLIAAYGVDVAQRALTDRDAPLQRAIAELPNAAQLSDKARRLTRQSSSLRD